MNDLVERAIQILTPLAERHGVILRIIECQEGQVDMEVMFEPRPAYGGRCARFLRRGALGWRCERQDAVLMLQTDIALAPTSDKTAVHGITQLAKGQKRYLSLTLTEMMPKEGGREQP